jgi:hypothetical protein
VPKPQDGAANERYVVVIVQEITACLSSSVSNIQVLSGHPSLQEVTSWAVDRVVDAGCGVHSQMFSPVLSNFICTRFSQFDIHDLRYLECDKNESTIPKAGWHHEWCIREKDLQRQVSPGKWLPCFQRTQDRGAIEGPKGYWKSGRGRETDSTDSHTEEHLERMKFGVATARRGRIEPHDVMITLLPSRLLKTIKR